MDEGGKLQCFTAQNVFNDKAARDNNSWSLGGFHKAVHAQSQEFLVKNKLILIICGSPPLCALEATPL